jgi:flagellar motility protein MotE (MotC chaperone)
MKSSFFSTGLITLTALLSIKGAGLLSDLYRNMSLKISTTHNSTSDQLGVIPDFQSAQKFDAKDQQGSIIQADQADNKIKIAANTENNSSQQGAQSSEQYLEQTKVIVDDQMTQHYTHEDLKLFGALSQRSKQLNEQQQNLDLKEAMLTAIENNISQKIEQMASQQQELQKTISAYDQKESAEIKSLANIYSNMKPRDAAIIFNELDMPLLIKIVNSMKERSVAQIISQMNYIKVKDLSIELSKSSRNSKASALKPKE